MAKMLRPSHSYYILFLILLFAAILLVWQPALSRISIFHTSHYSPRYSNTVYPLSGNARVTQSFKAKYPGLNRIDVYFNKPNDAIDDQFVFRLKDSCQSATDLETTTFGILDIPDHGGYAFIFPPIDDSTGRDFCITLEPQLPDLPTQLGIYGSQIDVYPNGAATYQPDTIPPPKIPKDEIDFSPKYTVWLPIVGKRYGGVEDPKFDVGFVLHYSGPTVEVVEVLLTRLAEYKPFLFAAPWFYILLAALYLINLVVILWLVINTKTGNKL